VIRTRRAKQKVNIHQSPCPAKRLETKFLILYSFAAKVCKMVSEKDKPQKYVCSEVLNGAYAQIKLGVQPTECRIVKYEEDEPKVFATQDSTTCTIGGIL